MKMKSIAMALVLIVFVSASLLANNNPPVISVTNQKGSTVYKVVYKSSGKGKVSLKISSNKFGTLYTEEISFTDQFVFPVDFNGMSKGIYSIEVSDSQTKLVYPVKFENKKPSAYVKVASQSNERYLLTIASELPADFTVKIYDRWYREVLVKNEKVKGQTGVLYNLAQAQGPFTFQVIDPTNKIKVVEK